MPEKPTPPRVNSMHTVFGTRSAFGFLSKCPSTLVFYPVITSSGNIGGTNGRVSFNETAVVQAPIGASTRDGAKFLVKATFFLTVCVS